MNNLTVPKLKSGIYKNSGLSAQKAGNGQLVSNQSGVQKKTFEYLTANMANDSGHAQTLDDKATKGELAVGLTSKLQGKKERNDMLTDYFSAKKKLGR